MKKVYQVQGKDYLFYCYGEPIDINIIFDDNIKLVEIVTKDVKVMKINGYHTPIYTLEEAADVFYKKPKKFQTKTKISHT